jgi:predicted ATPase
MNMTTVFSRIQIDQQWRQFNSVDIDLNNQMTVLTGANGCGKTTLLTILSNHFGWNLSFVSTPYISKKKSKKFFSDLKKMIYEDSPESQDLAENIGRITYSDGSICNLISPPHSSSNPQYQLQYSNQQSITGLFIPSHRPAITYQSVGNIPTDPKNNQQHYQEFQQLLLQTYGSANVRNPGHVLKQSLISLALFGYGNQVVAPNKEYLDLFETFQIVLKALLPENIGFQKLEIRMPDVVLVTKSGDFAMDAMSGGVNSIFGIAWQIHMYGAKQERCTVLIDEPENHLHPSMQRTLLPSLVRAFPNYKFIVATHSPFIVTSSPDASVFALTHNSENQIISHHLEQADLAGSPDKVLREILEVPSTIPVWVEDKIKTILMKYENELDAKNKQSLNSLFEDLKKVGFNESLSGFYINANESKS